MHARAVKYITCPVGKRFHTTGLLKKRETTYKIQLLQRVSVVTFSYVFHYQLGEYSIQKRTESLYYQRILLHPSFLHPIA